MQSGFLGRSSKGQLKAWVPSPGAKRGGMLAKREKKGVWLDETAFAGWSLGLLAAGFGLYGVLPGRQVRVTVVSEQKGMGGERGEEGKNEIASTIEVKNNAGSLIQKQSKDTNNGNDTFNTNRQWIRRQEQEKALSILKQQQTSQTAREEADQFILNKVIANLQHQKADQDTTNAFEKVYEWFRRITFRPPFLSTTEEQNIAGSVPPNTDTMITLQEWLKNDEKVNQLTNCNNLMQASEIENFAELLYIMVKLLFIGDKQGKTAKDYQQALHQISQIPSSQEGTSSWDISTVNAINEVLKMAREGEYLHRLSLFAKGFRNQTVLQMLYFGTFDDVTATNSGASKPV